MKISRLTMVAIAASVAGCASNEGPMVGPAAPVAIQGTQVVVENSTTSSLRVYALAAGAETPLGRVDALSQRTVRLPEGIGGAVQLVARPSTLNDDRRRHVSEPINLMEGQRITWELRLSPGFSGAPRMSTVRVFACTSEADC